MIVKVVGKIASECRDGFANRANDDHDIHGIDSGMAHSILDLLENNALLKGRNSEASKNQWQLLTNLLSIENDVNLLHGFRHPFDRCVESGVRVDLLRVSTFRIVIKEEVRKLKGTSGS